MSKKIEMIGKKFGRLTVVAESNKRGNRGQLKYECVCECGKRTVVLGEALRKGKVLSCGCLQRERASEANKTHGGCCSGQTKRGCDLLYSVWQSMKDRCFNPNNTEYKNYGGRGVTICEEWLNYAKFREFMIEIGYDINAPRKTQTIDRIDVMGNYEPNNCRLLTLSQQQFNKTNNRLIEFNGETKTATEWARSLGVKIEVITRRLDVLGWSIEEALTKSKRVTEKFTVDGETHTTKEWAQILNIPWNTLRDRMRRNGKQEELEKIVREKRNKRSN